MRDDAKTRTARALVAQALVGLQARQAVHALRAPDHFVDHDKDGLRTREERRAIAAIRDAVRLLSANDANLIRDEVSLLLLDRPRTMGDIGQLAVAHGSRFGVEWVDGCGLCFLVHKASPLLAVLCLNAGMRRADPALFNLDTFVWFPAAEPS